MSCSSLMLNLLLNFWMCALWTALSELALLKPDHGLRPCGREGGVVYSECYGGAAAERITRLYLSINTDQQNIAHNKCSHRPMWWLGHFSCFSIHSPTVSYPLRPSPPLSCPEKTCANGCVRDIRTERVKRCMTLPALCKLSLSITQACNWSSVEKC